MDGEALKNWRKSERARLIREREALAPELLEDWRARIDRSLERSFPGLACVTVGFCWPVKNEYDARHVMKRLRERGARTALPVVVQPKSPLIFREWHPGVRLEKGVLDIPFPAESAEVRPDAVVLPMNGWDTGGYRLGYGGGFFDRTLASLAKRPVTIGVSFEFARLQTIYPQAWDIPMDYVLTERGVYRRDAEGLVYLGEPDPGEGRLASPVCYADEAYFGGQTRNSR